MPRRYVQSIMLCLTIVTSIETRYCGKSDIHSVRNAHYHKCQPEPPPEPSTKAPPPPPPLPPPESPEVPSPRHQGYLGSPKSGRRNHCCPYDFDSRLCKVVHDRVLCGYNKNRGKYNHEDQEVKLSHGCRIRGGRLECGYVHAPFTNPRRPLAHDPEIITEKLKIDLDSGDDGYLSDNNHINNVQSVETNDFEKAPLKYTEMPRIIMTTPKRQHPVTRCVEIGDRIVCRGVV